ncbi:hypothetical protein ABZ468_51830 [Streptomyces sp. NPDC005708]|uniref:hypothetical protein n=1 Tax=Streptomyces sp. NPDC005708 TaxID=3154564 RepID=UPI0033EAF19C
MSLGLHPHDHGTRVRLQGGGHVKVHQRPPVVGQAKMMTPRARTRGRRPRDKERHMPIPERTTSDPSLRTATGAAQGGTARMSSRTLGRAGTQGACSP